MIVGANGLLNACGLFVGLLIILALNVLFTFAFPLLTSLFGFYGAMAARLLLGACQGPVTSIIAASMYFWVLPTDLTSMYALVNIGGGIGTAASAILAGKMIAAGYSWKTVYIVDGALMVTVLIIYFIFGDDDPEGCSKLKINRLRPFRFSNLISEDERQLIIESRLTQKSEEKRSVPWKKLILSKNIWIFSIAWFFATFSCEFLSYQCSRGVVIFISVFAIQFLQPRFFQYLILIDLDTATDIGTLVSIFGMFIILGVSKFVDRLCERYETQLIRKGSYAFFTGLSIAIFLPVIYFPCEKYFAVVLTLLSNFSIGLILTAATKTIPNEIGGEFSGLKKRRRFFAT